MRTLLVTLITAVISFFASGGIPGITVMEQTLLATVLGSVAAFLSHNADTQTAPATTGAPSAPKA